MFSYSGKRFSHLFTPMLIAKRLKSKKMHWAKLAKQKTATQVALEHFDELYGNIYGKHWPSIRVAILTKPKYVALVNNFSDTDRIVPFLENLGAMNVRRVFNYQVELLEENNKTKKKTNIKIKDASFNTDRTVEQMAEKLKESELRSIYPEGAEITDTTRSSALEDSSSRLIEPDLSGGATALYEFIPATKLKGKEDWIPESDHYRYYAAGDEIPIIREEQSLLEFPSELKMYSFVTGCCDPFPRPKKSPLLGVTDYYLMDGASLLPIIALDLKPGDNFLDMCAAPGGKSLIALQTLYPNIVTVNDKSLSRCNRMRRVLDEFILHLDEKLANETLRITNIDGRNIEDSGIYNKILVDAPCTTDRRSVNEDVGWENNIFKSSRLQERIKLPEIQSGLLASALKLVKVGGTVVYSTCSLSPIQNDGVVLMALKTIYEQTNIKIAIIDMTKALEPTKVMYRYRSNVLRYGHLVVPYLPDNYGPSYFCKFVRLE